MNDINFSKFTVVDSKPISASVTKKFMANVFGWMFVALGLSAVVAIAFATSDSLGSILYQQTEEGMRMSGFGKFIAFVPLIFVLVMSFAFNKLSAPLLTVFFLLFAAAMGMSLSTMLLIYSTNSVIGCFVAASAMFGTMAIMGYTTDKDLTGFGNILMMGLVGVIVASMVNWFLHSQGMAYILSILGVAIFTGLTAYDVQKLKRIGAGIEFEGTPARDTKKLALMGALNLYLDFINIFILLLNLFGGRRN